MQKESTNTNMSSQEQVFLNLTELFQAYDLIIKEMKEEFDRDVKALNEILFFEDTGKQKSSIEYSKTPQQTKKRSKRLLTLDERGEENVNTNNITSENETIKSTRPGRAAKMNLDLKEKPLGQKIRRPSNFNPSSITNVYIKTEKLDTTTNKSSKNLLVKNSFEPMEIDESENNRSSVLIVPKQNVIVEIGSDSENDQMPPPMGKAPKTRRQKNKYVQNSSDLDRFDSFNTEQISFSSENGVTRKESDESVQSQDSPKILNKIKKQKSKKITKQYETISKNESEFAKNLEEQPAECLDSKTSKSKNVNRGESFESVYEDAIPPPLIEQEIKTDVSLKSTDSSNVKKRTKKPKIAKRIPKPIIIKEEKLSSSSDQSNICEKIKNETLNNLQKETSKKCNRGCSFESVYEDAFTLPTEINIIDHKSQTNVNLENKGTENAVINKTVTVTADTPAINPSQETFIIENTIHNMNSTVTVNEANLKNNINLDVESDKQIISDETYIQSSIITEDNSQEESERTKEVPNIKVKPKPKSKINKNQIFNPYIESPMKKKVEAFEKIAADVEQNPSQRTTRTKTREKQQLQQNNEKAKIESKVITALKETTKNTTPIMGRHFGRVLTPSQSMTTITPTIALAKKLPNSTSKTIGISKASTEDFKKGYYQFQQIAAERKKKREEKQQQALIIREQKEKERLDRLKRTMEDREKKKKAAEQKRQLEDIQKTIKMLEERDEYNRKLEKQKLLEKQEAAAVAKKERQVLENLKIQKAKEEMQLQYLNKQKVLQSKEKDATSAYNFDMIQTDDETDDEQQVTNKRPPLPEWSRKETRILALQQQARLPTEIIDKFFFLKPLTPDLKEIFPKIDDRHCKRNSSMYWATPPRYSQLPKY